MPPCKTSGQEHVGLASVACGRCRVHAPRSRAYYLLGGTSSFPDVELLHVQTHTSMYICISEYIHTYIYMGCGLAGFPFLIFLTLEATQVHKPWSGLPSCRQTSRSAHAFACSRAQRRPSGADNQNCFSVSCESITRAVRVAKAQIQKSLRQHGSGPVYIDTAAYCFFFCRV